MDGGLEGGVCEALRFRRSLLRVHVTVRGHAGDLWQRSGARSGPGPAVVLLPRRPDGHLASRRHRLPFSPKGRVSRLLLPTDGCRPSAHPHGSPQPCSAFLLSPPPLGETCVFVVCCLPAATSPTRPTTFPSFVTASPGSTGREKTPHPCVLDGRTDE